MSSVQCLREFVTERLTAAAEEIFGVFEKTIVQYEEEINRQRRLLDMFWKPEVKLHRIELPQQHVREEEEVLTEQQLDRNSSLDQKDPEPPQIKEEQEELCSSQEGEQLGLKQETDAFMLSPAHEESELREPEPISELQLVSASSTVAENQDQTGNEQVDSGSTRSTEPEKRHRKKIIKNVKSSKSKTDSNIHADKKPFKCDVCGRAYKYKSGLEVHQTLHTSTFQNLCSTCGKIFCTKNGLSQHLSHKGEKLFSCDTCDKIFCFEADLKNHMSTHSDKRPHSCDTCGKHYKSLADLSVHKAIHTGAKPYLCNTCGKRFRKRYLLVKHTRVHTGEKPFSCEQCGRDFRFRCDMVVHMRIHTDEKPYSCERCKKGFRYKCTMLAHKRSQKC